MLRGSNLWTCAHGIGSVRGKTFTGLLQKYQGKFVPVILAWGRGMFLFQNHIIFALCLWDKNVRYLQKWWWEHMACVWCTVLIWQQKHWYYYEIMFSSPTHYVLSWLRFCYFPLIIDFLSTALGSQPIWEEGAELSHIASASAYTQPPPLSTSPPDGTCVTADEPILTRHHPKAVVFMGFTLVLHFLWVWTSV